MKKSSLLLCFIAVALMAGNIFAKIDTNKKSKYALVRPVFSDGKNEGVVIPLTDREARALLNKPAGMHKFHNAAGIIDTLISTDKNAGTATVGPYFGGDAGDTFAVYFSPGAGCKILEIGFNCGYLQNNPTAYPTLWNGLNVSLNFATYDGNAEEGAAASYVLGQYSNGVWTPNAWYAAHYPGPPIGKMIWGSFPTPIIADPFNVDEIVKMEYMQAEADCQGKDFVIAIVPYGSATSKGGFDDTQGIPLTREQMIWKWYISTGKWHLRQQIGFYAYALVEYYENTSPFLTAGGPYLTVVNSNARTLECYATDIDANNEANAGVKEANIVYRVNEGDWNKAPMSLADGTKTDGLWKGDVPAGTLSPGDVLTFYFEMTDGGGLSSMTDQFSYNYFAKTTDILFYYDDKTLEPAFADTTYWHQSPHRHNTWDGINDGVASDDLLNMYDYIVRIDGGSPVNLDSTAFQAWLASGTAEKKKYLFWSSQEFLGLESLWTDSTYAADDWHNMYLGIGAVKHDLQWAAAGYPAIHPNKAWPVNAVANDILTGGLAKLCKDSSFQLLHNPPYELAFGEWADGLDAGPNAVVCFTDKATGQGMGLHKEGATFKTVFLGLDQLALDINPPYTNANYHWPEYDAKETSVLYNSLIWFGAPERPAAVDDDRPGLVARYNLSQNYPNPFNPETRIAYTIARSSLVNLSVYNVLGQKVAELVNKQQESGSHYVTWNASDLASGVYFYRLEAGDYTRTLKMMLLR